ncbi:hypothetical protein AB0I10_40705 [Streptomyces sp. NPDC050636]|uniref:hypothetical protein n=1 Tax=Streptomyces sp. NPDC050636 TaxID=3154510 RepID=UPI00344AFACA
MTNEPPDTRTPREQSARSLADTDGPSALPAPPRTAESEAPTKGGRKAAGIGCGAVVLLAVVAFLSAITDSVYPDVKPEKMADRISAYSQDAYAALDIDRAVKPGYVDVFTNNTYGSDYCYPDGLLSIADNHVKGAYRLHHRWTLAKVSKTKALTALRRLHAHLQKEGWRITEYGENQQTKEWKLTAEREGGYGTGITWEPEFQRLSGGSGGPCAVDPDWSDDHPYSYGPDVGHPPALTP